MRRTILLERPSLILATLGGAAGVLFFGAALHVAGVWAAAPAAEHAPASVWAAALLPFLAGWLILPAVLVAAWQALPGHPESLPGALLKGTLFAVGVWALAGVASGLLGDWFAAGRGARGVAALFVGALGYGLVTAAIASMGRGMAPLHALGWEGHGAGRAA